MTQKKTHIILKLSHSLRRSEFKKMIMGDPTPISPVTTPMVLHTIITVISVVLNIFRTMIFRDPHGFTFQKVSIISWNLHKLKNFSRLIV